MDQECQRPNFEQRLPASGKTLAEATDAAIERYNRKHGITAGERPESVRGLHLLEVRGWVS